MSRIGIGVVFRGAVLGCVGLLLTACTINVGMPNPTNSSAPSDLPPSPSSSVTGLASLTADDYWSIGMVICMKGDSTSGEVLRSVFMDQYHLNQTDAAIAMALGLAEQHANCPTVKIRWSSTS